MYKLLFLIITIFVILLSLYNSTCEINEKFTDIQISKDNISDYIYKVYKADVKAIQNLSDISIKIQQGSLVMPSDLTIGNVLKIINSSTIGDLTLNNWQSSNGPLTVNGTSTFKSSVIANNININNVGKITVTKNINIHFKINNSDKMLSINDILLKICRPLDITNK